MAGPWAPWWNRDAHEQFAHPPQQQDPALDCGSPPARMRNDLSDGEPVVSSDIVRMHITRLGRSPQRTLHGLASLSRTLPQVAGAYGLAATLNSKRLRTLLQRRFMPEEAWELGLFDPALPDGELERYLSKSALKHLQESLNPASWAITVEEKALFYRFCRALGIATPDLYAVVYRRMPGWTQQGNTPDGPSTWATYLRERLPERFVLKPSWGVYGREVRLFVRRGSKFFDHTETCWDATDLVNKMLSDPLDRGWILQERLAAHDTLRRVSESAALQTFRIITLAGTSGERILHAHLKIIVGDNPVDNYDRGRRGNLQARIDVERGVLGPAALLREGGRGFAYLARHPATGHQIEGLSIPYWDAVCSFTLEVARQFLPLQTVGWDVALTPDGPKLVEGNAWYDPPPVGQGFELPEFARQLQKEGSLKHE